MIATVAEPSAAIRQNPNQFCWLSGYSAHLRPAGWYAPWWMQIAHIASGGGRARRVNDLRAVIILSPLAHSVHVSDSDRHPEMVINGKKIPTIDERHSLFLKQRFDEYNYDPEYLESIWIGRLPKPARPPQFWCELMARHRGLLL